MPSIRSRCRGSLGERRVLIGGPITMMALSGALFARDHWKGGLFIVLRAPPVLRLADLLGERTEGR